MKRNRAEQAISRRRACNARGVLEPWPDFQESAASSVPPPSPGTWRSPSSSLPISYEESTFQQSQERTPACPQGKVQETGPVLPRQRPGGLSVLGLQQLSVFLSSLLGGWFLQRALLTR